MRITLKYVLILLVIAFLCFSCKEESNSIALLNKAENVLENNPKQALAYLDSIESPQEMDKENYMLYIVSLVKARKTIDLSIANNTQIFKAQEYFNEKEDYKNGAQANFYAAWVYLENNEYSKVVQSFLQSASDAEKSNNKLFAGRSFNNIGYFYFQESIYDSAVISYKKSLNFYNEIENGFLEKLTTNTNLGLVYSAIHENDSAIVYFDKCLALSKSTNNRNYEFYSLQNLGINYYEMGLYDKSTEYLNDALAIDSIREELSIMQIKLYLLNICNKQRDTQKAKQYVDFIKANINKVRNDYTVKEIYAALSEYYNLVGDYKQALYYIKQEKLTKEQIEANNRAGELLKIENDFYLLKQEQKNHQLRSSLYLYIGVIAVVALLLLVFVLCMLAKNKRNKVKMKELLENYNILKSKIKPK